MYFPTLSGIIHENFCVFPVKPTVNSQPKYALNTYSIQALIQALDEPDRQGQKERKYVNSDHEENKLHEGIAPLANDPGGHA